MLECVNESTFSIPFNMKRLNLIAMAMLCLLAAACNKQIQQPDEMANLPEEHTATNLAAAACQPVMYNLAVDPATGNSLLYKVTGSPTLGPVIVTPINGSAGHNRLTYCSGAPIRFATGLAFDPTTGIFYATTGIAPSSPVNHIIRFTDPNCVTSAPAVPTCAITLNLSDIERDQTTGRFYAINRSTVNPNNRIVTVGVPATNNIGCLPNPLSPTLTLRGLTFGCNGQLYVAHTIGVNMRVLDINKATGLMIAAYSYPGPITPGPGVAAPEMGLHFDCMCFGRFITGNYDPVGPATLMTDGLPAGLGGPLYNSLPGVLKPTVDFARP